MKKVIIIFLLFVCLSSYGQTNKDYKNTNKVSKDIFIGDSTIAILHYDSLYNYSKRNLFEEGKEINLTNLDISDIEDILKVCIAKYNAEHKHRYKKYLINLKTYKRQYIAIINKKGEKEVYVNCFCDIFNENWEKQFIEVKDGGYCFFHLKINLKTKKYYDFSVNGYA